MKKLLVFASILIFAVLTLQSCTDSKIEPEGNAQLYLSDIKFIGFGTVKAINGTVKTKVYTQTDSSSALIVSNLSTSFSITNPNNQDQIIAYQLSDNVKKMEISVSFQMVEGAAEKLQIANIRFDRKGVSKYEQNNFVMPAPSGTTSSVFELSPITIEF